MEKIYFPGILMNKTHDKSVTKESGILPTVRIFIQDLAKMF